MSSQYRFLISYIYNNQPNTLEVSCAAEKLSQEDAIKFIVQAFKVDANRITDIRITGLHHPNNPAVHPGHYQQPEG